MDVRIGVTYSPKELQLELADDTERDKLVADIEKGLGGGGGVLWFTDRRGRKVGVPADKLAYIELGSPEESRRVGFTPR